MGGEGGVSRGEPDNLLTTRFLLARALAQVAIKCGAGTAAYQIP